MKLGPWPGPERTLVAHMGLTTKGSIGAYTALTLEDAAKQIQEIHDAGKDINPDVMVICHGGPIAEPEDAQYILSTPKVWWGSSAHRPLNAWPPNEPLNSRPESLRP